MQKRKAKFAICGPNVDKILNSKAIATTFSLVSIKVPTKHHTMRRVSIKETTMSI